MAKTETIQRPNIYYGNTVINNVTCANNGTVSVVLPTAYRYAVIFLGRGAGSARGIYMVDVWGEIASLVESPNVSVTKETTSASVNITNNSGTAITVMAIYSQF